MKPPLIKTWLNQFIADHERTHPDAQWPGHGSESSRRLWGAWFDAMKDNGISEEEARQASNLVPTDKLWCEEHPAHLVGVVLDIRRRMAKADVETKQAASDHQTALLASRACPHCSGAGMVTLFHPKYAGSPTITVERVAPDGEVTTVTGPARVAGHCICALGAWMRDQLDGETRARVPCLVDVHSGRSGWLERDPGLGEVEDIRDGEGRFDWRAMAGSIGVNVGEKGGGL